MQYLFTIDRKLQSSQEVTTGYLTHLIVLASNVSAYNARLCCASCCSVSYCKLDESCGTQFPKVHCRRRFEVVANKSLLGAENVVF